MANPAAPAVPADIAQMLSTGPRVADGAGFGVSPPPGIAPVPTVALDAPPVVVEPAPGPEAGAAAPVVAGPVQTVAPVADAPTFAGTRARSRTITLEWPLMWRGQLFEAVVVSRPTTGQVAEYFDRLMAQTEASAALRFPVFFDVACVPVPDAVMDALDPDDTDRVMEAVSDFLPSRLRRLQAPQPEPSPPPAGDPIEPTS